MHKAPQEQIDLAAKLYEQFGSITIVANQMRIGEATVRRYLDRAGVQRTGGRPVFSPADILASLGPPADPIEIRRLRDDLSALRSALKEAERRAAEAEDIRAGVLHLTDTPLLPKIIAFKRSASKDDGRSAVLHLSDIHYGETVLLDEMDGANRYDSEVAKLRLSRFFHKAAGLLTDHWNGKKPEEIVLCLGGDLISGMIHAELLETNYPAIPAAVREVSEIIAGGIVTLREKVGSPIRVYGVPGNHGRMTIKPQSKGRAAGSFDMLVMDFVEAALRGTKVAAGVSFYRTSSPDAYFSIYGWQWLLTHGDTMGGKGGGTGYVGPLANIVKGHRKLIDTSWRSGRPVNYVLTGHFHTTGKTTFGWANGSVIGYGEYARDLRADPEAAKQNMLIVHPRYGVIQEQSLFLGAPDEGALYLGPATLVRPTFQQEAA